MREAILYANYRQRLKQIETEGVKDMLTVFDVAKFFIHLANGTGSYISNLKLQKLVYYAQAWHLALHDAPLFEDEFEAWVHGPVVPVLYQEYKQFKWKPIIEEATEPEFTEDVKAFLDEVAEVYFACDAYELEQMTHQEDPWLIARGGLPQDAPCNAIISKELMQEYYKARGEED